MKNRNIAGFILLICFGLSCTAIVAPLDLIIGSMIFRQQAAEEFPIVNGTITHSELVQDSDHGTMQMGVDIRYRYEVNGHSFEGKRFRYNETASFDSESAAETVARYPVGATAQIFYNPRNPADALLSPGVNGMDLMAVLALTPFSVLMLGFWLGGWNWLQVTFLRPEFGGVTIIKNGLEVRVRLPKYPPIALGLAALGGTSFLAISVVVAIFFAFHPTVSIVMIAFVISFGAGFAVYKREWQKLQNGDSDLLINQGARSVQLPLTFNREERVTFSFSEIEDVFVESVPNTSWDNSGGVTYSFATTIRLRGEESPGERLANWYDEKRADSFVAWLRQQFGLPVVEKPQVS